MEEVGHFSRSGRPLFGGERLTCFIHQATDCQSRAAAVFKGKVAKIKGNEVTIIGDSGKPVTIKGNAAGIKVGDRVTVKGGKIIKGSGKMDLTPNLNPQPEPPQPKIVR